MTAQRKPLLSDHKRVGKKLVPPLLQYPNIHLSSWIDTGLPQTIWLAVLHDRLGQVRGTQSALDFCKAAINVAPNHGYSLVTDFARLDAEAGARIQAELGSELLARLRNALQPFVNLYPQCPLAVVAGVQPRTGSLEQDVEWFKTLLAQMFDKTSRHSTLALATSVYVLMGQGRMFIDPNSMLARLSEIEAYPETEVSRLIASSVRATVNSFVRPEDASAVWPHYFWTRGFELEDCYFITEDEDDE